MTLSYDALLALARTLLAGVPSVSFGDALPRRKETNARRVHAAHLPAEEPVVVLYDVTGFGTGDEGYLVTPERLCWHDFAQPAQMLLWSDICTISLLGDKLHVNAMAIPLIRRQGSCGRRRTARRAGGAGAEPRRGRQVGSTDVSLGLLRRAGRARARLGAGVFRHVGPDLRGRTR